MLQQIATYRDTDKRPLLLSSLSYEAKFRLLCICIHPGVDNETPQVLLMGLQFIAFVGMLWLWNVNLMQQRKQSFPLSGEGLCERTFQVLCIGAGGRWRKQKVRKMRRLSGFHHDMTSTGIHSHEHVIPATRHVWLRLQQTCRKKKSQFKPNVEIRGHRKQLQVANPTLCHQL